MDASTALERSLARYQGFVTFGLCFIVVFAVTVSAVMLWSAYRIGQQSERLNNIALTTHNSLCALRNDMKTRYDDGVKFLADNPSGLLSPSNHEIIIPAALLQANVQNQKAALAALAAGGLQCEA